MRLALIAILLAVVVTVGIHAFSPNRRAKMIATFRRNKWVAAEYCSALFSATLSPITFDSCSQWTAFE
jgi:hypothetical protein